MAHFHGQRHLKGGIDIDESTIPDDAGYWKDGARSAMARLAEKFGEDAALIMVADFWNDNFSWKKICINTENLLRSPK